MQAHDYALAILGLILGVGLSAALIVAVQTRDRRLRAMERRQAALAALGQRAIEGVDPAVLSDEAAATVTSQLGVTRDQAMHALRHPADAGTGGRQWRPDEIPFLQSAASILGAAAGRRRAEEELEASFSRLHSVLETMTDAFYALDQDWRFVYLNEQTEPLLERNRWELVGQRIWDAFPETVGTTFEREFQRALTEQVTIRFEEYYPPLNRWFRVQASPSEVGLSVFFRDISRRRLALEQLQAETAQREWERKLLRTVLDVLPVGVGISDTRGKLLEANGAILQIWGTGPRGTDSVDQYGAFKGWRPSSPQPLAGGDWALARALSRGEVITGEEVEIETYGGHRKTILNSAVPIRDDAGQIVNGLVVNIDITERKQMEEALRRSEALLARQNTVLERIATGAPLEDVLAEVVRLIESASPDLIGAVEVLDATRNALTFAVAPGLPEAYRLRTADTGTCTCAGTCGLAMFQGETVVIADIAAEPSWEPIRETALAHGIRACWSTPISTPAGEAVGALTLYVRTARYPSAGESELMAVASHLAGIAFERARIEEAGTLKLQYLVDHMAEGVVAVDERGQLLLTNPAAVRMLGLSMPPAAMLLAKTGLPESLVQALLHAAEPNCEGPTRLSFPSGQLEVEAHVAPVVAPSGPQYGAIALLHDASAQIRLRRLQESFVASASHELRGPLTSLSAVVEAMIDGMIPRDQYKTYLRRMLAEMQRLRRISHEILDLSRLDSGNVAVEGEQVPLGQVFGRIADMIVPRCQAAGLAFSAESGGLSVVADHDRLEQVLVNLLENALKFTPPGGRISLTAGAEGNRARIMVADTGVGISPEHLPYVWERFYQVDQARTLTPERGVGLGLSIVRQLVERMGGEVGVESEAGKGSAFSVILPLAAGDEGSPGAAGAGGMRQD